MIMFTRDCPWAMSQGRTNTLAPHLIFVVLKCKGSLPYLESPFIACKILLIVTLHTLEVLGMLNTSVHVVVYKNEMKNEVMQGY